MGDGIIEACRYMGDGIFEASSGILDAVIWCGVLELHVYSNEWGLSTL